MDEANRKLATYAIGVGDGEYYFSDSAFVHSKEDALKIIDSCLALGVPVDDMVTSTAWFNLVTRVVDLERRVEELTK